MTIKQIFTDRLMPRIQKIYDDFLEAERYIPSERIEELIGEQHPEWDEAEIDRMADKDLEQYLSKYYTYMSVPSL